MPFAATAVVAMAVVATTISVGCIIDMDCSLNGLCQSGACACDKGWGGTDCGVLNLGPAPPGGAYGYVLTPCLSNHPACKNSPALLVVHNCHADSCILITTLRSDVPAHGRVRRRYSPNVSSWGAHVIKWTDNQYHMYVSEMWNDCGIDSWQVRCPPLTRPMLLGLSARHPARRQCQAAASSRCGSSASNFHADACNVGDAAPCFNYAD